MDGWERKREREAARERARERRRIEIMDGYTSIPLFSAQHCTLHSNRTRKLNNILCFVMERIWPIVVIDRNSSLWRVFH